jgi:hypothetical protein
MELVQELLFPVWGARSINIGKNPLIIRYSINEFNTHSKRVLEYDMPSEPGIFPNDYCTPEAPIGRIY